MGDGCFDDFSNVISYGLSILGRAGSRMDWCRYIYSLPFITEQFQFIQGGFFCKSRIHKLQIRHELFDVFVGNKFCGVPDLMDDALLDLGLWVYRLYGLREVSPSTQAIRISSTPRFLNPFMMESQNLALSFSPTYIPSTSFFPFMSMPRAI